MEVKVVNFRLTREEDKHLPAYDYTMVTAINTCPTWGLVRYVHKKTLTGVNRAMALEAGQACHEVFAAARLWELGMVMGLRDHMMFHGKRLFKNGRFDEMMTYALDDGEDERRRMLNFCLEALYSSGFVDNPDDKRRTMANIEEACIVYLDRYPFGRHPVWVEDETNPSSRVGIEVPVDVVATFTMSDGSVREYRFIGRMDGLHWTSQAKNMLEVQENKTTSRINEAWSMSFIMSHQLTGYCIGGSLYAHGLPVQRARVRGLALPQPRSFDLGGVTDESYMRNKPHQFSDWATWFLFAMAIYEVYKNRPLEAPKFSHSCSRYFRPCSFLALCGETIEQREEIFNNEMVIDEWSPLSDED